MNSASLPSEPAAHLASRTSDTFEVLDGANFALGVLRRLWGACRAGIGVCALIRR